MAFGRLSWSPWNSISAWKIRMSLGWWKPCELTVCFGQSLFKCQMTRLVSRVLLWLRWNHPFLYFALSHSWSYSRLPRWTYNVSLPSQPFLAASQNRTLLSSLSKILRNAWDKQSRTTARMACPSSWKAITSIHAIWSPNYWRHWWLMHYYSFHFPSTKHKLSNEPWSWRHRKDK